MGLRLSSPQNYFKNRIVTYACFCRRGKKLIALISRSDGDCFGLFSVNIIIISDQMTQFEFWYAYYDSLFLQKTLKLPRQMRLDHGFIRNPWPTTSCRALSECFCYLQEFIKCGDNWITSRCTFEELNVISENLNVLLHFLELQRQYACQFWDRDPRRVEASTTHLYSFLQTLIWAIIPYSTMTIFECKAANKLCVQIQKMKELFNRILKNVNSIAAHLSIALFEQERAIILNFFNNFVVFMKKLPRIKRNQLNHVHNLTKFIVLVNPLQIYETHSLKGLNNIKAKRPIGTQDRPNFRKSQEFLQPNHDVYAYRSLMKRGSSCPNLTLNNFTIQKQQYEKFKQIFSFPDKLNQQAHDSLKRKKNTYDSFRTLTTKMDSLSKNVSVEKNKNNTSLGKNKNKSNTISLQYSPRLNKSPPSLKRIKTSSFIRKATAGSPNKKIGSFRQRGDSNFEFDEIEEERLEVKSVMSLQTNAYKMNRILEVQSRQRSSQILIGHNEINRTVYEIDAKIKSKGWRVLRKYFWDRVKMRKLRQIISFPISI